MKWIIFIVLISVSLGCNKTIEKEKEIIIKEDVVKNETITKIFFVRHAEKKSDSKDPDLTDKGIERAKKLAIILQDEKIAAVYSTNYKRTIQTAEPTAKAFGHEIKFYNPSELNAEKLINENTGKTILVVGHSNTTPTFVNKVLKSEIYPQILHEDYNNLYLVSVSSSGKSISTLLNID